MHGVLASALREVGAAANSPDYTALVVAIATVALAVVTYFYLIETRSIRVANQETVAAQKAAAKAQEVANKAQENFYKLSAMTEINKLLGDEGHRKAREFVYEGYRQVKTGSKDYFKNSPYKESSQRIRAEFDMVGGLFINGLLPKTVFLEIYFMAVIYCWVSLEHNIIDERKRRNDAHYMKNFENLKEAAEVYRAENYPENRSEPY